MVKKSVKNKNIGKKGVKKKKRNSGLVGFVNSNFKLTRNYLRETLYYVLFVFVLFLIIGVFAFFYPFLFQEQILKIIKNLIEQTAGLSPIGLTGFIMYNNIKTAFFAVLFGVMLGIIPLSITVVNGYVLGFVANQAALVECDFVSPFCLAGVSVLWKLLPHGIFEIPAIIISIALGVRLGISLVANCIVFYNRKIGKFSLGFLIILSMIFFFIAFPIVFIMTLVNEGLRKRFLENFGNSLRVFILVVIPLLVIAGLIEGFLIWSLTV